MTLSLDANSQGSIVEASIAMSMRAAGRGSTWTAALQHVGLLTVSAAEGLSAAAAVAAAQAGSFPGASAVQAATLPRSGALRSSATQPTADTLTLLFALPASAADASQVGTHVLRCVISDSATSTTLLSVPVLVHVRMPRAVVNPTSLSLLTSSAVAGAQSVERVFTVASAGSAALRFAVSLPQDSPCWLSVSVKAPVVDAVCRVPVASSLANASCEASGLLAPGTVAVVTVILHTALIPPGVHPGTVLVQSTDPNLPSQAVRVSGISSPLTTCPTNLALGVGNPDTPTLLGETVLSNTADGDVIVIGALASDATVSELQPADRCAVAGNSSLSAAIGVIRDRLVQHPVLGAGAGIASPHSGWLWPSLSSGAQLSATALLSSLPASVQALAADMAIRDAAREAWWASTQRDVLLQDGDGVPDPSAQVLGRSRAFPVLIQQGGRLTLSATAVYTPDAIQESSSVHHVHLVVWEAARAALSVRSIPVSFGRRVGRTNAARSTVLQTAALLSGDRLGVTQDLQEAQVGASLVSHQALSSGELTALFSLRDRYGLPRPDGFDTISLQVQPLNESSSAIRPLTWVQALTSVQLAAMLDSVCSRTPPDDSQLAAWGSMLAGADGVPVDPCAAYSAWQLRPADALTAAVVQGVFLRPTRAGAAAVALIAQETVLAVENRDTGVTITQQQPNLQLQRHWPSAASELPVQSEPATCRWSEGLQLGTDGLTCTCSAGLVQSADALPLLLGAQVSRPARVSGDSQAMLGVLDRVAPTVTSATLRCVACAPGKVSSRATLYAASRRGVCNQCADDSFAFPGSTTCQECPAEVAKCTQGKLSVAPGYGLTADAASVLGSILSGQGPQSEGSPLDSAAEQLAGLIQKCPNVFACQQPTVEDLAELVEDAGLASSQGRALASIGSSDRDIFACTTMAACQSLVLRSEVALSSQVLPSAALAGGSLGFATGVALNVSLSVSPSQCAPGHKSGGGDAQLCSRCEDGFVHSPPIAASGGVCTSCESLSTNLLDLSISIGAYFVILLAILHSWHRLMVTISTITTARGDASACSDSRSGRGQKHRRGSKLVPARGTNMPASGVNPMFLVRKHAVRSVLAAETGRAAGATGAGGAAAGAVSRARRNNKSPHRRESKLRVGENPMFITRKHAVAAVLQPKTASPQATMLSAGHAGAGSAPTSTNVLALPAGGLRRRAPAAARRAAMDAQRGAQQRAARQGDLKRPTIHPQILRASAGVLLVLHLMLSGMVADVVVDHTSSGRMKQLLSGQHEVAAGIVPLPIHSIAWSCLTERFLLQVSADSWLHSSATRQVVLFAFLPFASGAVAMGMAALFATGLLLVKGDTRRTQNTEQTLVQMPSVFSMVWHAWWLAVAVALPRSMTGLLRVASVWHVASGDTGARVVSQWDMVAGSPEHSTLVLGAFAALLVQLGVLVAGIVLIMRWARGADASAAAGQPGATQHPGAAGCSAATLWRFCPLPLPISWSFLVSRRKSPLLPPSVPAYATPLLLPGAVWGCATVAALTTAMVAQSNLSTYALCFAFTAVWMLHEALRSYEVADSLDTGGRKRSALRPKAAAPGTKTARKVAGASMDSIKNSKVAVLGTRSLALQRLIRGFELRYMPQAEAGSNMADTLMLRVARTMRYQRIALHALTSISLACCVAQAGMAYESSVFLTDSRYSSTMEETFDVHGAIKACFIVLVGAFWGPLLLMLGAMLPWRLRGALLAPLLSGPLPRLLSLLMKCASQSVMLGTGPARDVSKDDVRPVVKAVGAVSSTAAALSSAVYKGAAVGPQSSRRRRQQRRSEAASKGSLPRALDRAAATAGGLQMQSNPLQLARMARSGGNAPPNAVDAPPTKQPAGTAGSEEEGDTVSHMENPLREARAARRPQRGAAGASQGFGLTSVRRVRGPEQDLGLGGIVLRHNLSAAFGENKRSSMAVMGGALSRDSPIVPRGTRRAMRKADGGGGGSPAADAAVRAKSRRRRQARKSVLA